MKNKGDEGIMAFYLYLWRCYYKTFICFQSETDYLF